MEDMDNILRLFALLSLVPECLQTRTTTRFEEEILRFTNDALGVEKFQEYLDNSVAFRTRRLDGEKILEEVAAKMESKYSNRLSLLGELAERMEASYTDTLEEKPYMDCCDENAPHNAFDQQIGAYVDPDRICVTGTGLRSNPTEFVNPYMVDFWKEKFTDEHPLGIQWIYYGSEEGVMYNYPAVKQCDSHYDPRYRPFYIETVTPVPKDIVIVIDRSGSMGEEHNGRTLMSIAIDAARTVIDTLNINDRVGIVAFSDNAETPDGLSATSNCYEQEIARATVENKKYLKQFVSHISHRGGTYYRKALRAAFRLIKNTPPVEDDVRPRRKVILFLTDGKPSDCVSPTNSSEPGYGYSCGYIYQDIRAMNAELNNSVVILTYGLSQSIDSDVADILNNMSKQILYDETHGEVTRGLYTWVKNPEDLRKRMASYYGMFIENRPHIHFTVPYQDAFGSGMIASMCRSVNVNGNLKGVVCLDEAVHELLSELMYAQVGHSSYSFMVDIYSRVLSHPYTAFELEITNHPKFTFLRTIEIDNGAGDKIGEMITSIITGHSSSVTATTKKIIPRGDTVLDGVSSQSQITHYFWRQVSNTKFVIGVAIKDGDSETNITWINNPPGRFLYHKLAAQASSQDTCSHFSALSVKDRTSVQMSLRAVRDPYAFLFLDEDERTIAEYTRYFTETAALDPGTFKNQIREYVWATDYFEDILREAEDEYEHIVKWRYLATENGIFRIFPAVELPKMYDATQRKWYKQSKASPSGLTVTRPYVGTKGEGLILTIAKVFTEGSSEDNDWRNRGIMGVLGMDLSPFYLHKMVTDNVPSCATPNCFLIDKSGYIITHHDWFIGSVSHSEMLNIHITEKEPKIARNLIEDLNQMRYDECINIFDIRHQFSWRVDLDSLYDRTGNNYEIHMVTGTNMYLIIKAGPQQSTSVTGQCFSCFRENYPRCEQTVEPDQCFCPCYEQDRTNYFYCKDVFSLTSDDNAICLPATATVDFSVVQRATPQLRQCYPLDCASFVSESECRSYAACDWCIHRDNPADTCDESRVPSCSPTDECAADQTAYVAVLCTTAASTTIVQTTTESKPSSGAKSDKKTSDAKEKGNIPGWGVALIVLAVILILAIAALVAVGVLAIRYYRNKADDGVRNPADYYDILPAIARSPNRQPLPTTQTNNTRRESDNENCGGPSLSPGSENSSQNSPPPREVSILPCLKAFPRDNGQTPDVAIQAIHGRGSAVNIPSQYFQNRTSVV